jgi:MYXO-CTERM domain-containing protein
MAYHNGFSWAVGGFYGVDAFFVLSGFLITTLLVEEWRAGGTISLGRFWARRARRLLPALFALVGAVGIVAWLWPGVLGTPTMLGDALSTLFYSANWYLVAGHASYFAAAARPSPFLHTWSLAIEEQFYLLWPLVVLAVLAGRRRRRRSVPMLGGAGHLVVGEPGTAARARRLERLLWLSAAGALASALWMAVLASWSETNRAYYGTDSRAQALLVGAAVAAATARWGRVRGAGGRRVAVGMGLVGMAATPLVWWLVPYDSSLAFDGGFLLASLAAAAVVAGVVHAPAGLPARLLGVPPLRWLGRISYGVYLWYWPVLLVMSAGRMHLAAWPLFIARVGVTVGLAAASYRWVEQPVRRGAFRQWRGLVAAPAGAGVALAAILAAVVAPVGWSTPGVSPVAAVGGVRASPSPVVGRSLVARLPGSPEDHAGALPAAVPPTIPAAAPSGPPVKVLLVGDSVAGSIGVGLGEVASHYGVELVNEGSPGCSLAMDQQIKVLWYTMAPGAPCVAGDPQGLLDQWRSWVDAFNPDVVVYLARGELFDQEVAGVWSNIGQPGFDRYLDGRFRAALSVLGSRGATVVLMSSPYYDSGTQPDGAPWPEDAPSRVVEDNAIMAAAVRAAAGPALADGLGWVGTSPRAVGSPGGGAQVPAVDLFDFGTLMSPGNHFDAQVDGVQTRCQDGVHFTAAAGQWLAPMLLPELVALGRDHQHRAPGGSWPGPLPPTVPGWWGQLPCR